MTEIRKSALIARDSTGQRILMARETGKKLYAFPGGKLEPHEDRIAALHREVAEELDTSIHAVSEIGEAVGSTPDGRALRIFMFRGELTGEPHPNAEIEALRWVSADEIEASEEFTPITKHACLPMLRAAGIFSLDQA